ncbi:MAG: hypothetical protein IJ460_07710 [Clostridia bacterium]|nr:hypothetical protein [Clostridia bacterium]
MDTLKFDLSRNDGSFKIMNAVNNGPCHKRHANDQFRSNLAEYKAARIPYARNHDAAFWPGYGGEHTVDITAIFPDFDADPYSPESYDFAVTDEYILVTLEADTETFYRLGQKIEHYIKKYGTIPPKDFNKWAVICEHIIRHYNEGWADGFELNIKYWEIWNEPDLDEDDCLNKRTWGGTKAQFFDMYEIAAKHLKSCFPNLMIGGPALANRMNWADDFLGEMKKREVPIDFFSWHIYCTEPAQMLARAETVKNLLIKHGYKNAESILNEWNYVKGWTDEFVYSIEQIIGIKGAAFNMACMSAAQHSSIDMLMYYDARPTGFNGLFDMYTYRPLKGYYPFLWYGMFYDMEKEVLCEDNIDNIYTLCSVDSDGKVLSIITYYTDDDNAGKKSFSVDFGREGRYEIYLLDKEHDGELVKTTSELDFTLKAYSCVLIKEI